MQLYSYFVSQSSEFCRHNPFCCFSASVDCCKRKFRYRVRKLLDTSSYHRFRGPYCLHLQGAAMSSQMLVSHNTTGRHNPERPRFESPETCIMTKTHFKYVSYTEIVNRVASWPHSKRTRRSSEQCFVYCYNYKLSVDLIYSSVALPRNLLNFEDSASGTH
jgi:hypothetical protein